ncbi:hypothetical protein B0H10DRAFT_1997504 [Mycena sp. CBHHK59/15]|nr:hypothetical protein B0H10DRAFT_1997504 [Mycena sp. CBHHK59/15]
MRCRSAARWRVQFRSSASVIRWLQPQQVFCTFIRTDRYLPASSSVFEPDTRSQPRSHSALAMTELYLALYQSRRYPDDPTKLHWMLVPSSSGDNLNGNHVMGYQIILPPGPDGVWQTRHTATALTRNGRQFYGCVHLGRVQLSKSVIGELFSQEPPSQGDTPDLPVFREQGRGWSCAQWVIRVLRQWEEKGLIQLSPRDPSNLYLRVCAMGAALRKHLEDDSEDEILQVEGSPVEIVNVNGIETLRLEMES